MANPKRPKKAFVQFAVAAVIAVVVGGLGLVLLFIMFTGVIANNELTAQQHEEDLKQKDKKLAALEKKLSKMENEGPKVKKKYKEVQVAMAIPLGTKIESNMLKEVDLAPGERPAMDSFPRAATVIGKVSAVDLSPGETITRNKLLNTEGMVAVTEGKRAVSIKVGNIGAVGGSVFAGSHVDIMATFTESQMTKTLLQNVRVISAGAPAGKGSKGPALPSAKAGGSITVEVYPEEAEMLALANKQAEFHLALRGFGDKEDTVLYGADLGQLLSGIKRTELEKDVPTDPGVEQKPNEIPINYSENPNELPEPAVPEPESQTFQMEIYKGANSESKEFQWQY